MLIIRSYEVVEDLVNSAYKINSTQFDYDSESYRLQRIIASVYTRKIYLDFTTIVKVESGQSDDHKHEANFALFKYELCNLI